MLILVGFLWDRSSRSGMGQILYKDRYLRYMDIKTNYFNMTQIEADSANDIDLCLRNFAIAARSAD